MLRRLACLTLLVALVASCGGPVRRVSEPAASIQQLSVQADGRWEIQLRLNNYSNVAMQFSATRLKLAFDNGEAAALDTAPGIDIGPESADVVVTMVTPLPAGRARLANALADGQGLTYTLEGSVDAAPVEGKSRSYTLKRSSALSPVPGLPGVLR